MENQSGSDSWKCGKCINRRKGGMTKNRPDFLFPAEFSQMQSRVWESKEIWGNTAKGLPGKPDWHSLCAVLSQESAFVWIFYMQADLKACEVNHMKQPTRILALAAALVLSGSALTGCGEKADSSRENSGSVTESSAHTEEQDAKDDLKDMVTDAEDGVRDLVTDAGDMAKDAGDAAGDVVKDAGDAVKDAVDDDSSKATSDER